MDPQVGPYAVGDRVLTKYEIKGLLGRGGHAFVYHGHDGFLDRDVAIKVIINPTEPGRDLRKRAQLEARVLCKLNHPNVVSVIDAGATEEGFVYIIMERLEGRTLREALIDLRTLTVSEALAVGAAVASGVEAAHAEKTVHRDLKPENVFILEGNVAKVLDFGIAKFLGQDAKTTQKDLLHGTLPYMSPEHLQGLRVTAQSDIFALGAMLYEMLAGRAPCLLGIEEPTMNAIAWAQINRRPPPLPELAPSVPRHVDRIVQRMIAKSPADRFATMQEVADALRAAGDRIATETGESVVPQRPLWVRSKPVAETSGRPSTWTTKPGPGAFGSTEIIGESAALAPMPAPSVMAETSDPRASIETHTGVVPNTAPGLSTSVHTSQVTSHRSSARTVVGVGLAIGTIAGVALGLAYAPAPERRAPEPAARAAVPAATVTPPSRAPAAVDAPPPPASSAHEEPTTPVVATSPPVASAPIVASRAPAAQGASPPKPKPVVASPAKPAASSVWVAGARSHTATKSAYGADDIQ
ncbi:MAG TPA: protein kinase [Polyangiaceae bacterium]|nr:protein kinase [Polyangiaceae bacterium]